MSEVKNLDLCNMSEAAKAVGLSVSHFWILVNYRHLIPAPNVRIHQKLVCYDADGLKAVKETVKKLRAEGVLRPPKKAQKKPVL